jgi:hypothetical protein
VNIRDMPSRLSFQSRRSSRRLRRRLSLTAIAGGVALLAAACGGHHRVATPPPSTTATTTAPTTSTTRKPAPAPPVAPLTGVLQQSRAQLHGVAVVVKIDNLDAARPQLGLPRADVVYEELVEGGLTRLAAVFQSQYPTMVGPVRSGRLTDSAIVDDLNHPVFAYAGTNAVFLPILRSQPITDVDADNHPGAFWRTSLAPIPHNLYTNIAALAGLSTSHAPPQPLFLYSTARTPFTGPGIAVAGHLGINFPEAAVVWDYDSHAGLWLRTQNGTPDVDRTGIRLSARNVVVQFVSYTTSGYATGEGGPPAPIPEGHLVGTGRAWYFSGGRVVKGTWSRTSLTSRTAFRDASGHGIHLNPGRTWVELVPVGITPTVLP